MYGAEDLHLGIRVRRQEAGDASLLAIRRLLEPPGTVLVGEHLAEAPEAVQATPVVPHVVRRRVPTAEAAPARPEDDGIQQEDHLVGPPAVPVFHPEHLGIDGRD